MLLNRYILALAPALFISTTSAQCVTPGYVPCLPRGSRLGGVAPANFDNSGVWDSLQSVASDPIQKKNKRNDHFQNPTERRDLADGLLIARQGALCCAPDPNKYCLLLTDGNIPFCYDSITTRFVFSDESYGYINNGTYFAADGTVVDFQDGTVSMTDGATDSFAPATSAAADATASSGTPAATVPGTGKVTSVASNGGSSSSSAGSASPSASPASSPTTSSNRGGSGGTSPSASSSSSSSSGPQAKTSEGMESRLRLVGAYALSAWVAVLVAFAVLL